MTRPSILIGVIVAILSLAPLIVPIFVPRSEINCEHQDINIKTGQARYSYKLWYVTVSERVEDTPLSLALQGETVDVAEIEEWQRANTFSPGVRHSPHYLFHSALHQAKQMEMIDSLLTLTPEQKKEAARKILIAWQQSGSDRGADESMQGIMEEYIAHKAMQGVP